MLAANRTNTLPLTAVNRGETVTLAEVRAGSKLRRRLADLGLNMGTQVRIVQCDPNCPLILAVQNDSRLALGQGMAQQIMVCPCEDCPERK